MSSADPGCMSVVKTVWLAAGFGQADAGVQPA